MKQRWVLFIVLVLALAAAGWLLRESLSLEVLVEREKWLRQQVKEQPFNSLLVGFLAYFLLCLVPGTSGKAPICGWLFGFTAGLIVVNLGLTAAATICFQVSRRLLRKPIEQRFHVHLIAVRRALQRDGAFYVLLLRVLHAPYTLVNYTLGVTDLRTPTFWWATQIGLLPGNIVWVYTGSRLPTLEVIVQEGPGALLSWELGVGLVALSVFPLVGHWLGRKIRQRLRRPAG